MIILSPTPGGRTWDRGDGPRDRWRLSGHRSLRSLKTPEASAELPADFGRDQRLAPSLLHRGLVHGDRTALLTDDLGPDLVITVARGVHPLGIVRNEQNKDVLVQGLGTLLSAGMNADARVGRTGGRGERALNDLESAIAWFRRRRGCRVASGLRLTHCFSSFS